MGRREPITNLYSMCMHLVILYIQQYVINFAVIRRVVSLKIVTSKTMHHIHGFDATHYPRESRQWN
jgi:hypothetical protein